ncbi:MAG: hypothetical protein B7Z08_02365 [Sphingomonadales bacterium 32-68-7]|nr:MAG: hypothetical protein B7Z33_03010 [Sphingomonadales bacterium 12-68-11]OYX10120.1 MAG: hypothetical protein B7Z08_02365 [Sphingomonadales bacterium 32-68-7]
MTVLFVLPAEFGIDPTGVGTATRLTEIANPKGMNVYLRKGLQREGVLTLGDTPPPAEPGARDHWEFEIQPYEGIELKYEIAQGKAMTFRWQATGPLDYDMHAHPFEGGTDLTESYSIEARSSMQGRYVAPFTGIHGWYWQNRSFEPVKLTLDASGALIGSRIFDALGEHKRELVP